MGSLDAGTLSARVAASRAICLAVLAMGGVAPSLVRAQSTEVPLRVRVTLAGCAAGDETARELMRLVRLELGSDGVEEVVTSARDDVRARIDVAGFPCNSPSEPPTPHNRSTLVGRRDPPAPEPPDRAGDASPRLPERTQGRSERRTPGESRVTSRISIADALTRKWVRRSIVLDDVPEGERPRALALAMAELLRASWAELAFADDPEAPPALVRSLDERLARVSRHARSDRAVTIRALAIGRFFPASPLFVAGGRLGVAFSLGAWSIHGGAIVAGGSRGTSIGEVFATAATGYLGGGLRWTEGRWARVTASIRGELGGVAASGEGRSDDVQSRDTGGLLALSAAEMSFELRLARAWSIALDVESGVVLAGISLLADGREAASLSGAFLGVSIGIVVAP